MEANPLLKKMLTSERAFVSMCAVADKPKDEADFHIHMDSVEAHSALKPDHSHPSLAATNRRWGKIKVRVKTLDQLLSEWEFPRLDALCVDVEGGEGEVLKGFDISKWSPFVIVLEAWQTGEHDQTLSAFGYERVWRQADNDCYVRTGS